MHFEVNQHLKHSSASSIKTRLIIKCFGFLQTIDGFVWLIVFAINKLAYLKPNQLENIALSDFKGILWCR